jgi:hypothetical protein
MKVIVPVLFAVLLASSANAQSSDAQTVARLRQTRQVATQQKPGTAPRRCMTVKKALAASTVATILLALPVAGIAAIPADNGSKAARWAIYSGAGYALGASAIIGLQPRCHAQDGMLYAFTPFAAAVGAFTSTR